MLSVVQVTLPFFALVLLGYLATRRGLLPVAAIPGLNAFVLFFALPCMLFRFGASTPIAQLLDVSVFIAYLPCALIMVWLTIALTRSRKTNWNNASLGALVAAFPNTGFMGMPMLVALLGAKVAGPTIITIVIDMVITTSLCVALSRLDAAGEHGALVALKKALLGMVSNPMPWAILLGTAFSAFHFELLGPVAKTVELLGNAASPVALFTIGAVLARTSIAATSRPDRPGALRISNDYWLIALLKLFLHPLLVLLVGSSAIQLGLPLSHFALTVMILVAALPSASNVALLAERFEADTARIARIILVSTALAFFTFSGAVALLT
ncbi:MAG: AEC family transporter [Cytophagales bacterium]|nr:AEC family transporter [Cytophagales bacterium]